jgi:hypothetical protein
MTTAQEKHTAHASLLARAVAWHGMARGVREVATASQAPAF